MPVKQQQRPTNGAPQQQQGPVIPFTRASRKKNAFSFSLGPTALVTGGVTSFNPIEIPAQGFLRKIRIEVTLTTAGNGAATSFAADGPFNALSTISVTNAAGDPLQVGMTGYQQFLTNKYGCHSSDAPWSDPRNDQQFTLVTGAGATGGSAHFFLDIPFETNPRDAFTAIPNLAANKSYLLQLQAAASSLIYGVAPTNPPTITIVGTAFYWAQPKATNSRNVQQMRAPSGNGSVSLLRIQTPPVTPGDKYVQLTNVGNVIRYIIFVLRTAAGARSDADWPATFQFIVNDDPMFYMPNTLWQSDMSEAYGLLKGTTGGAAVATKDAAGALDSGVYVLYQFMQQQPTIGCDHPRDQYLPTLDASKLQVRGTNWGATANTLEVITNEIKPTSSAVLFSKGGAI